MNAKLLFAATVALSIASSYAMADPSNQALSRDQVVSELQQAAANGTLRKTDYDDGITQSTGGAALSRSTVVAELAASLAAPKLLGPLGNRTFNQNSSELLKPSVVSRAQVNDDVQEAIATGTLPRTDYDTDPQVLARHANAHEAGLALFARIRGGSQADAISQARSGH